MLAMSLDNQLRNIEEQTEQRRSHNEKCISHVCWWGSVDGVVWMVRGAKFFFCAAVRGRCNGALDLQSTALKAHHGKINFTPWLNAIYLMTVVSYYCNCSCHFKSHSCYKWNKMLTDNAESICLSSVPKWIRWLKHWLSNKVHWPKS